MIKHTKIFKLQWAVFINNHFFPFSSLQQFLLKKVCGGGMKGTGDLNLKTQSRKHFLWLKTSQYVKKKKKEKKKAIKNPIWPREG